MTKRRYGSGDDGDLHAGQGVDLAGDALQDADDTVLEQDIYGDLNEAERIGSSDRLHIVAQVAPYRAGCQGKGMRFSLGPLPCSQART
ncbi:MAG: hypothetical protein ACUVXG_00720 [Anaerolineae bacterium]